MTLNSPFGDIPSFNPQDDFDPDATVKSPFGLEGTAPTHTSADDDIAAYFTHVDASDEVEVTYEETVVALPPVMAWIAWLLGAFMVTSGLLFGNPISATSNLILLAIGATTALLGVHGLVVYWSDMSGGARKGGIVATLALAAIFGLGLAEQNSVDGTPILKFTTSNAEADYNETLLEAMDLVELIDNAIKSDPVVLRAKQAEATFLYQSAINTSAELAEHPMASFGELPHQVADTVSSAGIALDKAVAAVNQSQQGRSQEADDAYQVFISSLAETIEMFETSLSDTESPVTSVRNWMQDLFDVESK